MKISRIGRSRAFVFLAMAVALVFALSGIAYALTATLHAAHVGADSEDWGDPMADDGGLTEPVVWHFVLNGLDPDTEPATLSVVFQDAGAKQATGIPVGNGSTQHFYIGTPAHDILLSGSAEVASESYNQLVLSHVALNEEGPPGDDDEEPPGDDDDEEPPPGDDDDELPPPGDEEEPSLPFTEEEEEESLPFTGAELVVLLGAGLAATTGITLRRISK